MGRPVRSVASPAATASAASTAAAVLAALSLLASSPRGVQAQTTYVSTPCTMLISVNYYRAAVGSPFVKLDRRLVASSEAHTLDMALTNEFMHDSSDGTFWGDRVASFFPNWMYLSENVGMNSFNESEIMQAWIDSPEHALNLRDDRAQMMGSAYKDGYWTQDFGQASAGDVPFPIDCTVEDGFAWPQPATPDAPFVGALVTSEGLCLDSGGGLGKVLRANTCVRGSVSQSWTLVSQGAGFFAQATGADLCIDVFGANAMNGTDVGMWSCTGNANQQFMQKQGDSSWIAFHSGMCIELKGLRHYSGISLEQWQCNGSKSQKITPTSPSGTVQPYNRIGTVVAPNGLCFDGIQGFGGAVSTTNCSGTASQVWSLTQYGSYFTIQSQGTNLCVDVWGESLANGVKIGLWTCKNSLNQLWYLVNGTSFVNLNSGKCIDFSPQALAGQGGAPLQQ
ncbi:hypothetical protein HK405_008181 [Cladochytrium tenue]|nr:hypothetical protein HK405_008181 [Cladochytrium tenue]